MSVTHYLGSTTYNVSTCPECGKKRIETVQEYHVGFGKLAQKFKEEMQAKGIPVLPRFDADDICECNEE